jgi:hypothetical protein
MLGLDQVPERKTVVFNADAAWTPQEKKASLWLCGVILVLVGLPSLAVAVVSTAFNAMFAYSLGATQEEQTAWVLASLGFSLFVIGIPIARPLFREKRPDLDRKAFFLWLACLTFSITSALGFSMATRDHSASVAASSIKNRKQIETEIDRLVKALDALPSHRPVGNIEASLNRAIAANARAAKYTDGCRRIENRLDREACAPVLALREELAASQDANKIEARIFKLQDALKAVPATSSVSDPQAEVLDWMSARKLGQDTIRRLLSILVALLVEAGSAIGLSVAAEAFVAVLRERSDQPQPMPQGQVIDLQATTIPETGIGIDAEGGYIEWGVRCVSLSESSKIKAKEAYEHYATWCGQNGVAALEYLVFGRRMTEYLERNQCRTSKSNGIVYHGIRLKEVAAPKLLGTANA